MIQDEIKSNNKLIAEFMGYVYFEPDVLVDYSNCGGIEDKVDVYSKVPIEIKDYGEGQKYFKRLPNPDFGNENTTRWRSDLEELDWDTLNSGNYLTNLRYHNSLDSLIDVVNKIKELKYPIMIYQSHIQNTVEIYELNSRHHIIRESSTKLRINELLFKAIVGFIKCYNEINKK